MDVVVWLRSLGLGKYEAAFDHFWDYCIPVNGVNKLQAASPITFG
jgi:hypothetical protein